MKKIYTVRLLGLDVNTAIPATTCLDVSSWIVEAFLEIWKETVVSHSHVAVGCGSKRHHHGDGVCWGVDEAVGHPTLQFLRS